MSATSSPYTKGEHVKAFYNQPIAYRGKIIEVLGVQQHGFYKGQWQYKVCHLRDGFTERISEANLERWILP